MTTKGPSPNFKDIEAGFRRRFPSLDIAVSAFDFVTSGKIQVSLIGSGGPLTALERDDAARIAIEMQAILPPYCSIEIISKGPG